MKDLEYYMSLKYPVLIVEDSDGSYFMEYADLPGCMTCGRNMEEILRLGAEARKEWFSAALERNLHIPEPKQIQEYPDNFKLRLPKSLYRQLSVSAKEEGVSMNQYLLYLISQNLAIEYTIKNTKVAK